MNRVAIKPMLIKIITTFTGKLTASILLVLLTFFSTAIPGYRATAQAAVAPEPGYSVTLMNGELAGPVEIGVVPGVPGVPGGTLYVANEGPPNVVNGSFVSKLNSSGTTNSLIYISDLEGASGLVVDDLGNIYVSQDAERPLRKYDYQGVFVFEFASHRPEFADPNTLTLTGDGRLLAPGYSNVSGKWRILAFDTSSGQRLLDFTPEFSFSFVNSIFFKDGLLYIAGTAPEAGMSPLLVAGEGQIPSPLSYDYPQHTLNGFTIGFSGRMYGTTMGELLKIDPDGSVTPIATGFEFARGLGERKSNGCVRVADYGSGSTGSLYQICSTSTASISGTIYDTQSPTPSRLPNVGVELLPPNGQGGLGFCSDSTGNFTLGNIPVGNYIISAGGWSCGNDPAATVYARTLYSVNSDGSFLGTSDPAQAKVFSLASGTEAIVGTDFFLVEGATVSGRVTGPNGFGLANVPVNVNGPGWGAGGCTDTNGYYTIKGISPGPYRISAGGSSCNNGPVYTQVFYAGDNNATPDWNSATLFTLISGQTKSNISFSNPPLAAIITGKVTNAANMGIANVDVGYCDVNGAWISGTRTDSYGNYTLAALAGTWKIMFNPWAAGGYYLSQWYNNKSSPNTADTVTVTAGGTASINAELATGVGISGRVTNSLGTGIADVDVWTEDLNGNWTGGAGTDSQGNYAFSVTPGTYAVGFNPNRANQAGGYYLSEWYNNQSSRNNRTFIPIVSGNTTIDAQLETGGAISGTVTGSSNNGIADVDVGYCDGNGLCESWTRTDSSGNYRLTAPDGNWKIMFNPWAAGGYYASEWYDDKSSANTANPVPVGAGATTSGINAQLEIGATVSGTVTANGSALANVQVNVHGSGWGYGSCTNADGSYTIGRIYPGTYRVSAGGNTSCPGGAYYGQVFYNNKTDWSSADLIIVNPGDSFAINFSGLVQSAAISGNLQGDPGVGVKNLTVVLHDSQGRLVASTTTPSDGSGYYMFGGLTPGESYRVKVYDPFLNYQYVESGPMQASQGTQINPNITLTRLTPSGTNLPTFKSAPQVYVYRTPDNQELLNLTAEIDDPSGCQPPSIKSVTAVGPDGQFHYLYHQRYQALIDQGTPYAESWQNSRDNQMSSYPAQVGNFTFSIVDIEGNRVSRTVDLGSYAPYKLPIPSLSSPANGSQVDPSNLTLTWNPVPGAARYQVRILEKGERIFRQNQTSAFFTVPPGLLSPGRWYSWQVIAMDNANSDNVDYRSNSPTINFYTTGGATPSPQPLNVKIVPWVSGSPSVPHDAYAGHPIRVKAVGKGGAPPYTYTWDFGDGTPPVTDISSLNLGAKHLYVAASDKILDARITVTDSAGASVSALYPVKFWANPSRGVKVNVAIDEALWWLHKNFVLFTSNGIDYGYLSPGSYPAGTTAMALQALVLNGHAPDGDPDDPYTEDALRARNFLRTQIFPICIGPETAAGTTRNPDSNGNGKGLYVKNGHRLYETGLVLMALSTLKDPTLVETVQDLVDYLAYAQVEPDAGGGRGGWRYDTNYRESDMSVTQFPLIGLEAAEYHMSAMGVAIPPYVKDELKNNFLYFVQNREQGGNNFGGFGYSWPNSWVNVAKTGAGVVGMALTGFPFSDLRVTNALQFIDQHWYQAVEDPTGNNQAYNIGDLYAMYAVMKGMKSYEMRGADTTHVGGHDWYDEYAQWEIQNQQDNGTWQSPVNSYGPYVDTAFGVLLLLPQVFDIGPTAVAQASPTQLEAWQSVTFSHSGSFHRDTSKSIVSYAWDFNGDGITDWTTTRLTDTRTYRYTVPGTYTAILKATDNTGLIGTDQVTIVVTASTLAPVTIKIEPSTLNLKSKGVFTAFITLPANSNYDLANIDTSSLTCEGAPVVNTNLAAKKLIAKFNREDLKGVLAGDKVTLTVTGTFKDGRPFAGSDTVKVLSK